MKSLVIRTDAGPSIGTGHLMRCLALAESWYNEGGKVCFVLNSALPVVLQKIQSQNMEVVEISDSSGTHEDALNLISIADKKAADWIVIDGYQFGSDYQKMIKEAGHSLLFIDDYGHSTHYFADIVLNQNIYADISLYPYHESYTKFLLGSKYVLLRRQFLLYKNRTRHIPPLAKKILITLGGGDSGNLTLNVIEAIKNTGCQGLEVIVVVGCVNPHLKALQKITAETTGFSLIQDADNMPDLMAWADMAISAGGSTCWELVFMGVPFLSIILSDNQSPIVQKLHAIGATISLGGYNELSQRILIQSIKNLIESQDNRSLLQKNQRKLIDGNGCSDVIRMLT